MASPSRPIRSGGHRSRGKPRPCGLKTPHAGERAARRARAGNRGVKAQERVAARVYLPPKRVRLTPAGPEREGKGGERGREKSAATGVSPEIGVERWRAGGTCEPDSATHVRSASSTSARPRPRLPTLLRARPFPSARLLRARPPRPRDSALLDREPPLRPRPDSGAICFHDSAPRD
jgi:hypothetical protein